MDPADTSNLMRSEAELLLQESRKKKAEKIKTLGSPIELAGVALGLEIRGNHAWIAENTAVARKVDLETGRTLQLFRGHSAPLTCLAFFDKVQGSGAGDMLVTGSWDKVTNMLPSKYGIPRHTKKLISSTLAHSDFVKALFVIPSLQLLISGSSDKIVRFWDLSAYQNGQPLQSTGSISAHLRPVEAFSARVMGDSAILYTADTMGMMKVWKLTREDGSASRWKTTLLEELNHHRTRINEIVCDNGMLWTASSDDTVQVVPADTSTASSTSKPAPPIVHPTAVRAVLPLLENYLLTGAGDVIRLYDVCALDEPELLSEVDGHWHDVTMLRVWMRKRPQAEGHPKGAVAVEPWVVSASLDGTLRKWNLAGESCVVRVCRFGRQMRTLIGAFGRADMMQSSGPKAPPQAEEKPQKLAPTGAFQMSEEEERELAELMSDDDE
ncbi:uncharacterized protein FIBRA_05044 [Fibroporia radiculosa]|uniref:Uncharacterized protein n=1 Tax=Fibroporia radiculosa TaxID=599839 RepID=J4H3A4_9APHY|nr:uncharacterized protein FIBRA_05044 [Fibroporia radiculosa]CCM02929.1 predicted protein [Fibroporia radiculosa]